MVFLKEFFEKLDFEKVQQTTKSMKNYPRYKELEAMIRNKSIQYCHLSQSLFFGTLFFLKLNFLKYEIIINIQLQQTWDCYLLILSGPIATKVICFSRLLKCLRSLYGKQNGPRADCSYRSSLFWVHTVCLYT